MPCLESSVSTLSVDGGLRPNGRGNHGLVIASFTTLSITSSACIRTRSKAKHEGYVWNLEKLEENKRNGKKENKNVKKKKSQCT